MSGKRGCHCCGSTRPIQRLGNRLSRKSFIFKAKCMSYEEEILGASFLITQIVHLL